MLDLDYIKNNTIWVVKFTCNRITCNQKELYKYENRDDVRDIDTVCWQGQPKELQEFYKAYEHAYYNLRRHDLFLIEDFYNEWIKDPNQFNEEHKPVISKLSVELEKLEVTDDLVIENYDFQSIGNHKVGNYIETLQELSLDYDVIEITHKYGYNAIIIQEDDQDKLNLLSYTSNKIAMKHDKYLGDGKYS